MSVVIPVYNAFAAAIKCIESVIRFSPEAREILVIDDCSGEGDFAGAAAGLTRDRRLRIIRNPHNLGFVGSCNRGMLELSRSDDIVLLNSDTIVTRYWLRGLRAAADSGVDIGTVTPLTNNGDIAAVPQWGINNSLPAGHNLEEFAALVRAVSLREYPELPTAIGFCMYLRRALLERIGGFDPLFGKGYGEENDLSARAIAAGFKNILDDSTYIFHHGNLSFGDTREQLIPANRDLLSRRHPQFFSSVESYVQKRPLWRVHARIDNGLTVAAAAKTRASVLHILHNGPFIARDNALGGTELHVQDLINESPEFLHWSLVPGHDRYFLSVHLAGYHRTIEIPRASADLRRIVDPDHFSIVHLHHEQGYDRDLLHDALQAHGRYFVSVHDYSLLCKNLYLMASEEQHCDGLLCHGVCFGPDGVAEMQRYRAATTRLLAAAERVIVFSVSSREYLQRLAGVTPRYEVLPHGIHRRVLPRRPTAAPLRPMPQATAADLATTNVNNCDRPLRVLFLGAIPKHKGAALIVELVREASVYDAAGQSEFAVEWHLIGELIGATAPVDADGGACLINHGPYARDELRDRLLQINPHLVLVLSICPESFCYTLDESWNAGIPALVTPLGAPAERVRNSGAGWILPELSAACVRAELARIAADWPSYSAVRKRVRTAALLSVQAEVRRYAKIIAATSRHNATLTARPVDQTRKLLRYLQPGLVQFPPRGKASLLARRVLRPSLDVANRVGGDKLLENFYRKVLPERIIERIDPRRDYQE